MRFTEDNINADKILQLISNKCTLAAMSKTDCNLYRLVIYDKSYKNKLQ